MLIQSLRNLMKPIMWAILILVVPSFIALYGYQGIQQQRQREAQAALTVNGRIVDMDTYLKLRQNQIANRKKQLGEAWYEGMEQDLGISEQTVKDLIRMQVLQEKAEELGVHVSNQDLRETIEQILTQRFGAENFSPQLYLYFLRTQELTPSTFEESVRADMAAGKVQEILQLAYHVTEPELEEAYRLQNTKYRVEYLQFPAREMLNRVTVDKEGLEKYFSDHREDYTVPEKVRLRYLRLSPRDYESYVPVLLDDLQGYYDRNLKTFEIPKTGTAEAVFFPASDYVAGVTATDEILQTYLDTHQLDFRTPERRRILYTDIPVKQETESGVLPEKDVREYYESHLDDYRVDREQADVRRILLVLAPEASPREDEDVQSRISDIRAEIEAGKPFAEAAKEYSEDTTTKEDGGEVGWVSRGGPGLSEESLEAAFTLPVGSVSEPIRTSRGYEIIQVEAREPGRVKSFDEVAESIRGTLATERLQRLRFDAMDVGLQEAAEGQGYPLTETQPFTRAAEVIDATVGADTYRVAFSAFRSATGEISPVISGRDLDKYYLFEVVDVLPEHDRTLAEAREDVLAAYRESQAKIRAENAAGDALDAIMTRGVPFEEAAGSREILHLASFHPQAAIPELGADSMTFTKGAFEMKEGQVDTIAGADGVYLTRLTGFEEPRVPELAEIRGQLERDVRKMKAPIFTQEQGDDILSVLDEYGQNLASAVELASKELQLPVPAKAEGETALIGKGDEVDVIGWGPSVTQAGLRLKEPGERYDAPIPVTRRRGRQMEVVDYFLIELEEKVPEHQAELAEVRDKVEADYRLYQAALLAQGDAREVYGKLEEAVEAGKFTHPSRKADLRAFSEQVGADYGATDEPFSLAYVPRSSPLYGAEAVLKTISTLSAGDLSGLIEARETVGSGTNERTRVRGYFIVQVVERDEPDMNKFAEEKENLLTQMRSQYLYDAYTAWLESVERSAEVERHEALERRLAFERGELSEEEYYDTGR